MSINVINIYGSDTRSNRSMKVSEWIEAQIERYSMDGQIEDIQSRTERLSEIVGRLIETLADKGILSVQEASQIGVGYGSAIEKDGDSINE